MMVLCWTLGVAITIFKPESTPGMPAMLRLSTVLALLLTLALSACGPQPITSQVVRFHQLPPIAGRTFSIQPWSGQVGNLEFESYADQVAARLQRLGMVPDTRNPDYLVHLDYGVGPPQTSVRAVPWPDYGWGGLGYGGWGHRRHWGLGLGYTFGPRYDVYTITRYDRWLHMEILDGAAARRGRTVQVFEGRAISVGSSRALPDVMPYLVTALFEGFPGVSGQSIRVAVPVAPVVY